MPTFQLNFTGLCAFSPSAGSKTVILVNARDHGGESHIPVLLASRSTAVVTAQTRPFNLDLDAGAGNFGYNRMVGWSLEAENLTLSGLDNQQFSIAPGPSAEATCPTDADREGFGWVASMERAEGARLDPEALTTKDPSVVLARLTVNRGRLATAQFAGFPDSPLRWAYLRSGNETPDNPRRAIAEVVNLTATFSGTQIRIQSQRFGGTAHLDIVLDRGQQEILTAWLVNMPLPDLLQNRPGDPAAHPHFRNFYRLSNKKGGLRFPHSQGRCRELVASQFIGLDIAPTNPKCPPATFESLAQ